MPLTLHLLVKAGRYHLQNYTLFVNIVGAFCKPFLLIDSDEHDTTLTPFLIGGFFSKWMFFSTASWEIWNNLMRVSFIFILLQNSLPFLLLAKVIQLVKSSVRMGVEYPRQNNLLFRHFPLRFTCNPFSTGSPMQLNMSGLALSGYRKK